ncbi:MAG: helix-turn-helix domain-containing protein, partial [Rhodospirillales bacterium]
KYARGSTRGGASGRSDRARVLDVRLAFLFEDMDETPAATAPRRRGASEDRTGYTAAGTPITQRETLELVRAYYHIDDADVRRRVFDLVRAMGHAAA